MPGVRAAAEAKRLLDVHNIGPAMIGDLRMPGMEQPQQLTGKAPHVLYERLCRIIGVRHDPCVPDTFISAVRFMEGAPPRPWWHYD